MGLGAGRGGSRILDLTAHTPTSLVNTIEKRQKPRLKLDEHVRLFSAHFHPHTPRCTHVCTHK